MVDVSIVLNVHDESTYIDRTLTSLAEAIEYATHFGLTVETVIVADRPCEAVRTLLSRADLSRLGAVRVIEVDHGSLALSRNAGIDAARGRYITTADADDLVSFNYLLESFRVVDGKPTTVSVPEFLYVFGEISWMAKYFGSDVVPGFAQFNEHRYVSRIFLAADLLRELRYRHPAPARGEAYEDWDLNCRLAAAGARFVPAEGTVLFYRKRRGSIMSKVSASSLTVAYSDFFEPRNFVQRWAWDYGRFVRGQSRPSFDARACRAQLSRHQSLVLSIHAANRIDPSIRYDDYHYRSIDSNLSGSLVHGAAYFEACSALGGAAFSDVILLPFIARAGGEKFILQVVEGLREIAPDARPLFLTGEACERHEGIEALPADAVFVDLHEIGARWSLGLDDILRITWRLIQSCRSDVRVHVKSSAYGHQFIRNYAHTFQRRLVTYYYFLEATHVEHEGLPFTAGYSFQVVSEDSEVISNVVSDNTTALRRLSSRIPLDEVRLTRIPAYCPVSLKVRSRPDRLPEAERLRLLWASRIDVEKRPQLLAPLAKALREAGLPVEIDVYGSSVFGLDPEALFPTDSGLRYRGPFASFDDLAPESYDAFLYTSAFDGMPNVILEALAAGLPVIAPDVGGIGEAVGPSNGILVDAACSDDELISRMVEAIRQLRSADLGELSRAGIEYVARNHSREALLAGVRHAFGGAS